MERALVCSSSGPVTQGGQRYPPPFATALPGARCPAAPQCHPYLRPRGHTSDCSHKKIKGRLLFCRAAAKAIVLTNRYVVAALLSSPAVLLASIHNLRAAEPTVTEHTLRQAPWCVANVVCWPRGARSSALPSLLFSLSFHYITLCLLFHFRFSSARFEARSLSEIFCLLVVSCR